ncbi:hypothetical protein [Clostridium sp. BJN0013]|uniref:hypothetical protein n=1 Tax=Clostridium sp. BJN0013 TaxID=3236840 RepID=UPI0034C66AAE
MNKIKNTLTIEEKMEYLREKLNNHIINNLGNNGVEAKKSILAISEELDKVIFSYIKNFNKKT